MPCCTRPHAERSSSQTLCAAFAPFRTCRFNQWSHRFRPSLLLHARSSPLSHAAAARSDRQHQATCRRRRRWHGLQQNARRIVRRRNNSSSRPPAPSIARGCAAAPMPATGATYSLSSAGKLYDAAVIWRCNVLCSCQEVIGLLKVFLKFTNDDGEVSLVQS